MLFALLASLNKGLEITPCTYESCGEMRVPDIKYVEIMAFMVLFFILLSLHK
jgi:hypothetical protein